jgi:hypothetical protein
MTTALEGDEESVSRSGPFLPLGKTRYLLYRRLGGPQGRSGQVRKISPPTGIRPLKSLKENENVLGRDFIWSTGMFIMVGRPFVDRRELIFPSLIRHRLQSARGNHIYQSIPHNRTMHPEYVLWLLFAAFTFKGSAHVSFIRFHISVTCILQALLIVKPQFLY